MLENYSNNLTLRVNPSQNISQLLKYSLHKVSLYQIEYNFLKGLWRMQNLIIFAKIC